VTTEESIFSLTVSGSPSNDQGQKKVNELDDDDAGQGEGHRAARPAGQVLMDYNHGAEEDGRNRRDDPCRNVRDPLMLDGFCLQRTDQMHKTKPSIAEDPPMRRTLLAVGFAVLVSMLLSPHENHWRALDSATFYAQGIRGYVNWTPQWCAAWL